MNARFETSSLNAWPALREESYNNWLLRFAGGQTRRSNSVNVLGRSTLPLDEKICHCEEAFADAGIRLVFKLAEIPHVKPLDRLLPQLGYEREGETNVMLRSLLQPIDPAAHVVTLATELSDKWLEGALVTGGVAPKKHGSMEAILRAVHLPHVFASIEMDSRLAAIGLAVADGDRIGIFDIVTDPAYRRQGLARSIMNGMMDWGRQMGGKTTYLQVVEGNDGALTLYDGLGFQHRYKYWYRGRPVS